MRIVQGSRPAEHHGPIRQIHINQQKPESYHQYHDSEKSKKNTCYESIPVVRQHRIQIPIEKKFQSQSIRHYPHHRSCQALQMPTSHQNAAQPETQRQTIRLELIKCQNRIQPRSLSPIIQRKIRPINQTINETTCRIQYNHNHHRNNKKLSIDTSENIPIAMKIKFANSSPQSSTVYVRRNEPESGCRICKGGLGLVNNNRNSSSHNCIPIYF